MRYACLVYLDVATLDHFDEAERARLHADASRAEEGLRRSGHLVSAEALAPVGAATTLALRDGRVVAFDRPAVRARAAVASLFILDARDLNEAMRLASGHPLVRVGRIEIRPVRAPARNAATGGG